MSAKQVSNPEGVTTMEEARAGLQEALASYHNILLQKVTDHFKLNLEEVRRQFPIPANIGLKIPDDDSLRPSRTDDKTNQVVPNEQGKVKGSVRTAATTAVPAPKQVNNSKPPAKAQKKPVKSTKTTQAKRVCKIPDQERCRARVWVGGGRCTRRQKGDSTYCWNHMKGTPHGTIDDEGWVDPEAGTVISSCTEVDTAPQANSQVVSKPKPKPKPAQKKTSWEQVEPELGQPTTESDLRETVESKFGKKALTTYGKQLKAWWAQNKPDIEPVAVATDITNGELEEEDGMQCEIRIIDGKSLALDTTTNKVYQVLGNQDYVGRWNVATQQLDKSVGEWDEE